MKIVLPYCTKKVLFFEIAKYYFQYYSKYNVKMFLLNIDFFQSPGQREALSLLYSKYILIDDKQSSFCFRNLIYISEKFKRILKLNATKRIYFNMTFKINEL